MTDATTTLPTWDMTTVFPAIDSPEREISYAQLLESIDQLGSEVASLESLDVADSESVIAGVEGVIRHVNALSDLALRHITYLYGFTSVDSRNRLAQAKTSELMIQLARLQTLQTRLTAWLGSLDVDALVKSSDFLAEYAYQLRKIGQEAEHLMSPAEEALQSELTLSGGSAWSTMYGEVTSQITVPFELDGEVADRPITEIRNLAYHADRSVRQRAHFAEIDAWKAWETPLASALNGIKGQHITVSRRRHWNSVLDEALFQNSIDRATLDAMLEAARDSFPDLRRYFRAKARLIGVEQLAFFDLFAPVTTSDSTWSWDEAWTFVADQFGTYSDTMRQLVLTAVEDRWIDVGPRPGKSGGAFCMPIGDGKSRVLHNFGGTFDGVSTLAHELGHAYHNLCQKDVPSMRREGTPMTLAETASTFCETILRNAAIEKGTADEKLAILEGSLQDAAQIVIDITSRFLFEQAVFDQRAERTLSPDEFCAMMRDAQLQTYGDGLDPETLHPYMWAAKSHYYSPVAAFYNYPYMFGLLFGLGLYARYQEDPEAFREGYDDLLAATGDADAATLAARFGIDTTTKSFWASSLDVIREQVDTFEALVDERVGG